MSVSNTNNISADSKAVHADYKFSGSMFNNPVQNQYIQDTFGRFSNVQQTLSFASQYLIPLKSVRGQVIGAEDVIRRTRIGIEDYFLRKLFINSYVDPDLNEAHLRVWKEASYYMDIPSVKTDDYSDITAEDNPNYICFDEYSYAEKSNTTASRRLISEFEEAISQSTFSYFFQLRKLLLYLESEIQYIKSSLLFNFGEEYESESQQQVALRFDTWAKMALHYTRRISSTILSKPGALPNAEVDQIPKKQAAQFQAFFAIRLNAVDEEINDLLSALKRDLVDNSEVFYFRFINNSIRMTKDIAEPLDLEYNTTSFRRDYPTLAGELVVATNVFQGNFASIHADLVERYEMMISRVDAIMMLIHEKRKYANYISQLADRSVQKKKILQTVVEDKYGSLFRTVPVGIKRNQNYKSSHLNLDDLDLDSHPQYLLKDGGTITGDIYIDSGVKIGGVSLSEHSHTGRDGSSKISILDIDFESGRNSPDIGELVSSPINVTVDGFVSDIIDGGIPVFDAIISIEIDETTINSHEYEIIYTEIE